MVDILGLIGKGFIKILGGTRNERLVRRMREVVENEVTPLEAELTALSDEQLLRRSEDLRAELRDPSNLQPLAARAYAMIREASRRAANHRQFDVQLIAGQVLYNGGIAEEATGEGKTVACYPAIYLNALQGRKVHVITVNDYLVERDAEFARPIFERLGMSVGFIQSNMPNDLRKAAYECDITYGTNSEFGFDYLRDNMKLNVADQAQQSLDFAIVDEVDNILIDEARTPLIISGPSQGDVGRFRKADQIARRLEQLQAEANRETARRIAEWDGKAPPRYAAHPKFQGALQKFQADPSQSSGFSLTEDEAEALGHVQYFVVNAEHKSAAITHAGVSAAQEDREIGAMYQDGAEWPHLITQALRARVVYRRDRDYVVRGGDVIIVDEFTGRLMEGRQWSEGLHQAVEAKEGVPVKQENQTLATITLQNYFKLYDRLAGMTGTAMTEADEFMKIYDLEVVNVPTNRPVNRMDYNDKIYRSDEEKFNAIVEEVHRYSQMGRPVLVGTTSVEKSERLSAALTRRYGIQHEVLNARPENAAREAEIVAKAGCQHPLKQGSSTMVGNVTIATNMAGRGTDIKLAVETVHGACRVPADDQLPPGVEPDPLYPAGSYKCCVNCRQYDAATGCAHCFKTKLDGDFPKRGRVDCRDDVPCGLHVVGTERHEARRIDNQLRGRSGRQGDPGSSRFFLSLDDDLMRIFAGPTVLKMLEWLVEDGMAIEHKRISKAIEKAQKRVEERNFDVRKHLLEYDEIMDIQRKSFYATRQRILEGRDLREIIRTMIAETVDQAVETHLADDYAARCVSDWARATLRVEIDPDRLRGRSAADAERVANELRRAAMDDASADIARSIGEYIDPDMERRDWDLSALSQWAQSRYGVKLSATKLSRMEPDAIQEEFIEAARARIEGLDLTPVASYLDAAFPRRALAQWVQNHFDLRLEEAVFDAPAESISESLSEAVMRAYRQRELEYPIEYALQTAFPDGDLANVHHAKILCDWLERKFRFGLDTETVTASEPADLFKLLLERRIAFDREGRLDAELAEHMRSTSRVADHIAFAAERFDTRLDENDFLEAEDHGAVLRQAGEKFLRREFNELERFVLLSQYDSAWKEHLLAMDHLRGGIGLRGYAEQDPKIAYKREGTAMFQEMLEAIRLQVSRNIFRVRLSGSARMNSVYQVSQAVHNQLAGYDHLSQDMQAQQEAIEPKKKVETIVRNIPRVGRNDLCPCGSGKKFKKCCGRDQ